MKSNNQSLKSGGSASQNGKSGKATDKDLKVNKAPQDTEAFAPKEKKTEEDENHQNQRSERGYSNWGPSDESSDGGLNGSNGSGV